MSDLLPPNRTTLESRAAQALVIAPPVPLRTLWNPAACPVELLPFLAWAFSVDQWHGDWPEAIKRRVIANSAALHRIKGTRPAVELAMASLGADVELQEWFEVEPNLPRGTFRATLYVNENLTPGEPAFLNERLYDQLREAIDNAKNTRSHYDFRVGARFGPSTLGAAGAIQTGAVSRRLADVAQEPAGFSVGMAITASQQAAAVTRRTAEATTDATLGTAGITVAAAHRAVAIIHCYMECAA